MITFKHKGNFKHTEKFMTKALRRNYMPILQRYGQMGVDVLQEYTPKDTGKTAASWKYGISEEDGKITLYWTNSNENEGANIVLLLIYGYGLQNGVYVQGTDFVSPVMKPIFQRIANQSWREVVR